MRKPIIGASALLLAAAVAGCQEKSSASAANMSPARASSSAGGMSSSQAQPAAAGSASGAKPALAKPAAAGSTTEQAEKLLDQTMTYVKENKLDLAEKSLTAAEKLKPQLPASYSPRIDQARSALDLAKKGSAIGNAIKAPAVK